MEHLKKRPDLEVEQEIAIWEQALKDNPPPTCSYTRGRIVALELSLTMTAEEIKDDALLVFEELDKLNTFTEQNYAAAQAWGYAWVLQDPGLFVAKEKPTCADTQAG